MQLLHLEKDANVKNVRVNFRVKAEVFHSSQFGWSLRRANHSKDFYLALRIVEVEMHRGKKRDKAVARVVQSMGI